MQRIKAQFTSIYRGLETIDNLRTSHRIFVANRSDRLIRLEPFI